MEVGDLEINSFYHFLGLYILGNVVTFPSGLGPGMKIAALDDPQGSLPTL